MRTKLAVLTAAFVAAGALSSMAQSNVYSLNVVGYVNVTFTNGFNIVGNPLDKDGTGTNNTIVGVFSNTLPNNTGVFKFTGGGFNTSLGFARGSWNADSSFNPGEAIFLSIPATTSFTFVGQVLQGSQTNQYIVPGFNLLSSKIPLSGGIGTVLQYTPVNGDQVFLYNTADGYHSFGFARGAWGPSEPQLSPGQGMFINTTSSSWVQNFTVQ